MTGAGRRLATLIRLDLKLAARHKLVHATVIVALVFGALIGLLAPERWEPGWTDAAGTDAIGHGPGTAADTAAGPAHEPQPPTVLDPEARKPPFDESLLPVLYALDLCLLGFMFGSVMVLQDKQQGTIRSFRVGPGTGLDYALSKLSVNLGLSLLNLVIVTSLVAPWALARPQLYLLTILICGGMTLLGMAIATYLRTMAQWFFPLVAISLLTTTPTYLLVAPTSRLAWTFWVPTYHMLFGAEAVMFTGDAEVVTTAVVYGLGFFAAMAVVCGAAIRTRLLEEIH